MPFTRQPGFNGYDGNASSSVAPKPFQSGLSAPSMSGLNTGIQRGTEIGPPQWSRKRRLSTRDDAFTTGPSKARRTTPSTMNDSYDGFLDEYDVFDKDNLFSDRLYSADKPENVIDLTQEDIAAQQREWDKIQSERTDMDAARRLQDRINSDVNTMSPVQPSFHSTHVPAHVKSEYPGTLNMPGGYASDGFDDTQYLHDDGRYAGDDLGAGLSSNYIPHRSGDHPRFGLPRGSYTSPGARAAEAAIRRPQGSGPIGSSGHIQAGATGSPFGHGSSRPGQLTNGQVKHFPTPATPGSGSGNYGPHGTGYNQNLQGVINHTNGYNFQNGTDASGRPLPQRVQNFVNYVKEDPRLNEQRIKEILENIRPDMDIPEEDREETPVALVYPLYKHQQIALSWMQKMEDAENTKGGILADDMGLGKTISTLALIVSRKAPGGSDPRSTKTNLIVGPVSLLRQWNREIDKKLKIGHGLRVFVLHGTTKKVSFDYLRQFDVVLTTYGTLGQANKRREEYIKNQRANGEEVDEEYLSTISPVFGSKSYFHRLILDESQAIKNQKTLAAKAVKQIQGTYRWCLSGTPMMNNIEELQSVIEFLRIKPYCEREKFRKVFGILNPKRAGMYPGNAVTAMKRLQVLLKQIMLRRSKNSMIDGKPIIELPEKTEETVHVVFDQDEQEYYNQLEKSASVQVSKYLRSGTVGKHYAHVLALLLRLRQACCHPYLHLTDAESANSDLAEGQMVKLAMALDPTSVNRIKDTEDFQCPGCMDAVVNPSIISPCGHDVCFPCFSQLVDAEKEKRIQAGQAEDSAIKVKCYQCHRLVGSNAIITYEAFKRVHMPETVRGPTIADLEDVLKELDSDQDDSDEDFDNVDEKGNLKGFIVDDDDDDADEDGAEAEDEDSEVEELSIALKRSAKTRSLEEPVPKKSKKTLKNIEVKPEVLVQLRKESARNKKYEKRYMEYLRRIWEPSAKVNKCRDLIAELQSTGEKTIVFSQWTLLLDLLQVPIKHELKLDFRRYDGSMSAAYRDLAVREFMEDPHIKIMLVSLRAGNSGLNLTAASQIIIMDPFWNPYMEMQAVDRAHRIGQQRKVKVHRILIKNTIEDRIMKIQNEKRAMVDAALDEKVATSLKSLDSKALAYLFNINS
ncbi:SNF2 family N-terminal domain-containing protein [Xylariomycetidae sp. FL2044]|nr:SNF2 family N-terminal domain-containing protein [Xylariomycetidae sp. FL2044]